MERPEVVAQVRRYLTGELSQDELQDWLVPFVLGPDAAQLDPQTDDLVNSIQLYLAEFTSGHLTEGELREYFHALVGHGAEDLRYRAAGAYIGSWTWAKSPYSCRVNQQPIWKDRPITES